MNSFLKSIVLTAVVVSVNTTWAQEKAPECDPKQLCCTELTRMNATKKAVPEKGSSEDASFQNARKAADEAYQDWKRCKDDSKAKCTELNSDLKKITDNFPVSSMNQAAKCYSADADETDGGKMAFAVAYAVVGQTMPGQESCRVSGTKTNFSEQLKEYDRKVEDYTKDISSKNDELIKVSEELEEVSKKIEEARLDIQEKLQELIPESQAKQEEALRKMQENQDKISRNIRELNTQLLKARQDEQSLNTKLKSELQAKQVHSESSIQRTCEMGIQEYYNKRYGSKKGKAGEASGALGKGVKKKKDVKAAYNDCVKAQREIRSSIYEAAAQTAKMAADHISKLEADIAMLEKQFKSQVEQYNKFADALMTSMNNQQKSLLAKDQKLANEALKAQQMSQQKQAKINQDKLLLQQKLQAAHSSQGQISEKEVEEGVEKYEEWADLQEELVKNGCRDAIKNKSRIDENLNRIKERQSDDSNQ